jgi:hypothetical protein
MRIHSGLLIVGLMLAVPAPARAQYAGPTPVAAMRFESWQAEGALPAALPAGITVPAPRHRTRHALVGGAIGAVTGLAVCTAISTWADDSADPGLSFCPLDTNLLFAGGGFALGFGLGWVL